MKHIYSLRKNFTIIGLTGTMGSGCSKLAELLTKDRESFFDEKMIRKPENIEIIVRTSDDIQNNNSGTIEYENVLFRRKYEICYNYMQKNWRQYIFIDYKKVLFLYCFNYYINKNNDIDFEEAFSNFIIKTFSKAPLSDKDSFDDSDKKITRNEVINVLKNSKIDIQRFIDDVKFIGGGEIDLLEIKDEYRLNKLYEIFFIGNSEFNKLFKNFLKLFNSKNYYLRSLFFHKVGCSIRNSGNPEINNDDTCRDYVFNVSKLINRLIKSFKSREENADKCQIVINSLKNSLEIMYFKERYSAFYMMAVHNGETKSALMDDIVKESTYKAQTIAKLIELDKVEYRTGDFKNGIFSSPDIENCIQKSDIHIIYNLPKKTLDELPKEFTTLHEQLLKYLALIQQPGIITPSNIERCMQIAYNSKLSSGCVSRQVGAVVTNEGFAVKAIGWNDTPKKTIPCLLRNVEEVIRGSNLGNEDHTYSKFELPNFEYEYELNYNHSEKPSNNDFAGKNFSKNVNVLYPSDKLEILNKEGKNCSYCFKTLHNHFFGEENQVHTRSLHAEENAMLQISKFGGQGLRNGYLFVTASPCELCSKKSYQLGITQIYYIDRYPGIAEEHIICTGFDAPKLNQFAGVIGRSFNKLYEPFLAYKDELKIYMK